ncbi:hypothetical protein BJV82DRAFT_672639 [Fennellomyces sp. T-0311]|nr:hypothetical protein BJV82DRAFT_672639 [Fennellomyces sp. T-0311]
MIDTVLSIQQINLELFRELLARLETSINTGNCQQVIRDSTAAINQVFQSQLIVLLDIRAHAYAKQGYCDSAYSDACKMIDFAPELGAGYARQGDVFSMFGRQDRAIGAYTEGQEAAAKDLTQIERLAEGRKYAAKKNKSRIDYLANLPIEVTNNIIRRLRKNDKAACLSVSRMWRSRTLECSAAWKALNVTGNRRDLQLVNVMPHIGRHLETLLINTDNDQIRSSYLQHMINKQFGGIHTLKLSALATQNFAPYTSRMAIAFWQMRETLTIFDVDFADNENAITLADILLPCCNLSTLRYATTRPVATLVGDFSTMEKHNALASLELRSGLINGEDIRGVLQRCPQLRRLTMTGCSPTVLDPINQFAPNLEILGYNNTSPGIPQQSVTALQPPGLRTLYTNNGRSTLPADAILPLICKNMATLDTAFLNVTEFPDSDTRQFQAAHPMFKLENLTGLTLWSKRGVQSVIMHAIRDTTTLKNISLVSVHDLNEVVATLMRISPVSSLQLSYTDASSATASLVQLFGRYAALSSRSNTRQLHTINIRYCTGIGNPVLASLTEIQSLQSLSLRGLADITSRGVGDLLEKLPHHITYLELAEMDAVTDNHIIALRVHSHLSEVNLEGLPNITNQGLQYGIDSRVTVLEKLTIKGCRSITNECAQYLKRKVKVVVYKLA